MIRYRGHHHFEKLSADIIEGIPKQVIGKQYFVDPYTGNDNSSGLSFDKAFKTLQKAITVSNALIDWSYTPPRYNIIWVCPGVYAENLTPPYYAFVLGLGIRGTDTMAEIRAASGSEFTGTFLGTILKNLRFEHLQASVPILDLGICNNSHIEQCEFTLGADVGGVAGIDTENCTHLTVVDCDFESGQLNTLAYAAYHRGGGDKYAHNVRYIGNRMFVQTCGIWTQSTCTASQALAQKNVIHCTGTGKGIDGMGGGADTGGALLAVENDIIIDGAGDAIHGLAAGKKMRNHTLVNGSYALETA